MVLEKRLSGTWVLYNTIHACKAIHLYSKMRLILYFRGINGVRLSEVILGKIVSRHTPAASMSAIAKTEI